MKRSKQEDHSGPVSLRGAKNVKSLKRNKTANGHEPSNKQYLVSGYVMNNSWIIRRSNKDNLGIIIKISL